MLLDLNHHAHILDGEPEFLHKELEKFTKQLMDESRLQPADVVWQRVEVFGIDDSRRLAVDQGRRALAGGLKFFIISARTLTVPAQQALLKTFEEPTPGTHLCLVAPPMAGLLGTLRSRCQLVRLATATGEGVANPNSSSAQEFLTASRVKRLAMVRVLAGPAALDHLLDDLINETRRELGRQPTRVIGAELDRLLRLKNYLNYPGAQPRLVGEHLALVLPVRKMV